MPTAGKLTGALLFAALAWYVSLLTVPLFPQNMDLGYFKELNAAVGVYCGWRIAGRRAGTGYVAAISYGLTTGVALVVIALFLNSSWLMLERSMRGHFHGPFEAVVTVFEIMLENAELMATPEIIGTLVIGSLLGGLVTDFIGQRYS